MSREVVGTIDFESRSACDIRKSGSWKYSLDPTTEVLCLCWRLPSMPAGQVALWHPAFPHLDVPEEGMQDLRGLFTWILSGGLVEAHNSFFERGIWQNIMEPRYGWPHIQSSQWRCSAAKAAALALPRALEDAVAAMKLPITKDVVGAKVMKKMSKPRKPRKKEREQWVAQFGAKKPMPILWHESMDLLIELWDYCAQDVLAEEGLSAALPDLSPEEQGYYTLDQDMNERGFRLDRQAISVALKLIAAESGHLNEELRTLTGGAVQRATQRARMMQWLGNEGLEVDNTQADTLNTLLEDDDLDSMTPAARRALTILRMLGRSSTAKYETMKQWVCDDERVHGGLLFHGASTGRWSGKGPQPHNFPKPVLTEKDTTDSMEQIWDTVLMGDRVVIGQKYRGVMEALSHGLRGVITAPPGKRLYVADYNAIEARVVLWLAEDDDALEIFRDRTRDIYCEMSADIYGYTCTKKTHPVERVIGKVCIIALSYQMGWAKFQDTVFKQTKMRISEEFAQSAVNTYREKFWRVKQMWEDQHWAAMCAVSDKQVIPCGRVQWHVEGLFLYCTLPSGRRLAYPYPEVQSKMTPWGEKRPALTFMAVNPLSRKWQRQHTYGGMIVENQTQAVARDLMAAAMLRCEQSRVYTPILSVHDELISEAHQAMGDVREFEALMAESPEWAANCPVATEGFMCTRYAKN